MGYLDAQMVQELNSIGQTLQKMLSIMEKQSDRCETAGDDCARCQCCTCANRSTCKLKSDEILTDIEASPCNGCRPGERFRPVEAERCPKYIRGDSNAISLQSLEHGVCIR